MGTGVDPTKYIVFKRDDYDELIGDADEKEDGHVVSALIDQLDRVWLRDAVVIRRQDLFAAPALDTYANSITIAIDVLTKCQPGGEDDTDVVKRLQEVADYFHEQAQKSWETQGRKLPD